MLLWNLVVSYIWVYTFVKGERAGIAQCGSEQFPASFSSGGSAPGSGSSFLMQDKSFQFSCCGVLSALRYSSPGGNLVLQIWRQTGKDAFELVSTQTYTLTSSTDGTFTPADNLRVSFREGDWFGWSGNFINTGAGSPDLNWYTTGTGASSATIGGTFNWFDSGNSVFVNNDFRIQFQTKESTLPFFKTLPATLELLDTDVQTSGVTLLTLVDTDLDPDDVTSGLSVTMSPAWEDMFELTSAGLVKTRERLSAGTTYTVSFRVEEAHCGLSVTSSLTVTVKDSAPSIVGLTGFSSVHEDDVDSVQLKTFTLTDPTDQPVWCKGDWTPGPEDGTKKPFIVKMLSTDAGSSQAALYMIDNPNLEYTTRSVYELRILCYDTFENEVSGKYRVNVIENKAPVFANLGNVVQVNATTVRTGDTIFTVSANDEDSHDQITYTYTCSIPDCPVALFDSGEVRVTKNLLLTDDFSVDLTITATDSHGNANTASNLRIYIVSRNNNPTLTNTAGVTQNVSENSPLGTSLFQASASDADTADSLTFYMAIDDPVGYTLFDFTAGGLLSTSSTNNIDYDVLTSTTLSVVIYVTDGKERASEAITVDVINVNESPSFVQPHFMLRNVETINVGDSLADPAIAALDPDAGDTLTYSMNCGTYDSYFTLDPNTARLTYAQDYDLDDLTLLLPQTLTCSVVVQDTASNNATATLHLWIDYNDDNEPVFTPSTEHIDVPSDTAPGMSVLALPVNDLDVGPDSGLTFAIQQSNLSDTYFIVNEKGVIYANKPLEPTKTFGVRSITVTATDSGNNVASVTININFIDATVTPVVVDDRDLLFIEDFRNVWWVALCVITMATCLFLVICIIALACRGREQPVIDFNKLLARFRRRRRELDSRRRKKPLFDKARPPTYRHIHSNEVLRTSPPLMVATPAPVTDNFSMRPDSVTSGRVSATEVKVNEQKPSWMDGTDSPVELVAPVKSVTRPRAQDWDYINPARGTDGDTPGLQKKYYTPSEYVSSARSKPSRRERRTTPHTPEQGYLTPAAPVPVSPSPVQFDNTEDETDDFRSERLSMTSPWADDPQPTLGN